jgi:hypothetical protein
VGGAFVIGYLLGGRDREGRIVLGLSTGQRNIAAATVVARQSFGDPQILLMAVVVSTVSMLLFPLARVLRGSAPNAAVPRAAEDPGGRADKEAAAAPYSSGDSSRATVPRRRATGGDDTR